MSDQLGATKALLRREIRQLESAVLILQTSLQQLEQERTELQLQLLEQGDRMHAHREQLQLLELIDAQLVGSVHEVGSPAEWEPTNRDRGEA